MQYPAGTGDERALLSAAQRGVLSACAQLTARHQQDLLRLAYLWAGDQARAVALAQRTLARALLELPRIDPDTPFRPWLLQRLAIEATQRPLEAAAGPASTLFAGGGRFQVDDERSRLRIALQRLDAGERMALLLHDVGGLDLGQLGSALGRRPEALRAQLEPARRRTLLSVDLPDERALRAALNDAAVDAPRAELWPELEPEVARRLAAEQNRRRMLTAGAAGAIILLIIAVGVFIFGGGLPGGESSARGANATPSPASTPPSAAALPSPSVLPPPADVPERLLLESPAGTDDDLRFDYALLDPASGAVEPLIANVRYLAVMPDGQRMLFLGMGAESPITLYAVEIASGDIAWEASFPRPSPLEPASEASFDAAFAEQMIVVAVGFSDSLTVTAFDLDTGERKHSWVMAADSPGNLDPQQVRLVTNEDGRSLWLLASPSGRGLRAIEFRVPGLSIDQDYFLDSMTMTQRFPVELTLPQPGRNDVWQVIGPSAQFLDIENAMTQGVAIIPTAWDVITKSPIAATVAHSGDQLYAVAPYRRSVSIIDLNQRQVAGNYTLDITKVAPPGPVPVELRTITGWADGQLSPDGRRLYVAGPLREGESGLLPTIWEIDVARWTVERELRLPQPGLIDALTLVGSDRLYVQQRGWNGEASQINLLDLASGAVTAPPGIDAGATLYGSLGDVYLAEHGRSPSVAGVVATDVQAYDALPLGGLIVEPETAWPGDEVTVSVHFDGIDDPDVHFDPATSVTVQLTTTDGHQVVVLGHTGDGVYNAAVRLEQTGIWDAVATVSAAGVEHWTIEHPGALVVRSGIQGLDGMVYWPVIASDPDPLRPGSTALLTLRFVDLINGAPLPTGVSFSEGMPIAIGVTFLDDAGHVANELTLLRAGPGLYNGLIAAPPEGRYRLRTQLTYPSGVTETIDHGFITVTAGL